MSVNVVITGGHGFIGLMLLDKLLQAGEIAVAGNQPKTIGRITLSDITECHNEYGIELLKDSRVRSVVGDLSSAATLKEVMSDAPDVVYHLAAIVSGQAEEEFDLGLDINFQTSLRLFSACRQQGNKPSIIFSSSCAVYGGDLPKLIPDEHTPLPQTSYGAQKYMGEVLLTDYIRKGYVNGFALRLPTVIVRPGKPNRAASSFASGILREPLNGVEAVCPVPDTAGMWFTSPSCIVNNLVHALGLNNTPHSCAIPLPGMTASVAQMLDALKDVAGADVVKRVTFKEDPVINTIVQGWPLELEATKAEALGFSKPADMQEIIREYIRDHLPAQAT